MTDPQTLLCATPAPGVVLLTLNRPELMNAIDMATAEHLMATLDALEADEAVNVVVLTGAGRAFCAGFDIHEMAGFDSKAMMAAFAARDPLFWKVASHKKPIMVALNGITYGAGALMAAGADIRIGCPATKFKVTASSYGAANATWTLPRVVGIPKAKEILMTGRPVEAQEMLAIGLLNQMVEEGRTVEAAVQMAAMIAANPPGGAQGVKQLINDGIGRAYHDGWRAEFAWMADSTIKASTAGADLFSGFLAKRDKA